MVIKLTLVGLIILLFIIIAGTYYVNKEGFDTITNTVDPSKIPEISAANIPSTNLLTRPSMNVGGAISTESIPASTKVEIPSIKTPESSIPERNDVNPEVGLSETGYNAMALQQKSDLLKDIQKVVKNELISNRNTTPVITEDANCEEGTSSTAQGKEYEDSCYKDTDSDSGKKSDKCCPPVPDMTKYIKKDAIPCWGCSLDY
jgi:hypothetical protein